MRVAERGGAQVLRALRVRHTIRGRLRAYGTRWCILNLLGPDLLAELTLHLTVDGHRKVIASKLDEQPGWQTRQQVVQALLFTAIDMAKERGIGINWAGLEQLYPYPKPPATIAAPPPAQPG